MSPCPPAARRRRAPSAHPIASDPLASLPDSHVEGAASAFGGSSNIDDAHNNSSSSSSSSSSESMQTPFYNPSFLAPPFPYTTASRSDVAHGIVVGGGPPLGGSSGAAICNTSNAQSAIATTTMNRHEGSLLAPLPSNLNCTSDERQERLESGQCPGCGQLLFKINTSSNSHSGGVKKSTFFRRRKESSSSKGSGGSSGCNDHAGTMVPLSVPGSVERGQCLRCCTAAAGPMNGAANSTGSLQSSSGSLDWGDVTGATGTPLASSAAGAATATAVSSNPNHHASRAVSDDSFSDNPEDYGVSSAPPSFPRPFAAATKAPALPTTTSTAPPPPSSPVVGTATYQGSYNDYGERHGAGIMTWTNGDRYEGEFFNGVRHGHGSLFFADGSEYVGEWECNYMHGSGTRRFVNGDVYVGTYQDGKRCGPDGRFYFANGDLYVGRWSHDVMNGIGRYYYGNGQRFEGRFKNGKRHGPGKFQRVDGSLDQFLYVNDQRSGVGVHWSRQRSKAWRCDAHGNLKKRLSMEEAMTLAYEIDNTDC
jgi:hypothetical protein